MTAKKRILSDVHLAQLDDELQAEIVGTEPCLFDGMVRLVVNPKYIFPVDGYLCWEHRWLQGTGKRPPDW